MAKVTFEFEAKIAQFRAEISKVPGITKEQTDKMVKEWVKGQKAIAKAENDTTRKLRREEKLRAKTAIAEARRAARAYEERSRAMVNSGKQVGSLLGGTFGDLAAVTFDFGDSVMGATSGMQGMAAAGVVAAGALTGVAFAGAFVGQHIVELADAAVVASKELEEMGLANAITEKQKKALSDYSLAMDEFSVRAKVAKTDIGAGFAPALQDASSVLRDLGSVFGFANMSMGEYIAGTYENVKATAYLDPKLWGILAAVRAVQWAAGDSSDEITKLAAAQKEAAEFGDEWIRSMEDQQAMLVALGMLEDETVVKAEQSSARIVSSSRNKQKEKEREAAQMDAYIADFARMQDELVSTLEATASKTQRLEGEIAGSVIRWNIEANKQLRKTLDETEQSVDAMVVALTARKAEVIDELKQMVASGVEDSLQFASQLTDMLGETSKNKKEKIEEEALAEFARAEKVAAKDAETARARIDGMVKSGRMSEANARRELRDIDKKQKAEIQAAKKVKAQRRQLAMKAFKAEKRAARGEAIMQAAIAATKAMATFAPPPSPAGILALGSVSAQLATSLATISRMKAPQFPTGAYIGGSSDHPKVAYIQDGEAVLNRRATRNMGGEQAINQLNNGQLPSSQPTTIVVQLDPAETRRLLRGSPATIRIPQSDVHRGSRNGR